MINQISEEYVVHGWRVATLHTAKESMASRFATSTEEEIERLLIDKDTENTKEIHQSGKGTLSRVP